MNAPRALVSLAVFAAASAAVAGEGGLALVGGRLYATPTSKALDDAVVRIEGGRISAVGKRGAVTIPPSAQVMDCTGKVIVAGFWNSHVHFETGWENAGAAPAAKLQSLMEQMLTRWGFTTVWDLGSEPHNTLALRKRIGTGELSGPEILMAGDIFPKGGHPVYLPAEMKLLEAASPAQASQEARDYLDAGLDGIKLFTGAFMGSKPVVNMDTAIVAAAAQVAHAQGKPVFAHPQNRAGVDNALAGGVDVLAHTIPSEGSFSEAELTRMGGQRVGLSPTLSLWTTVVPDVATQNKLVDAGVSELKAYAARGGTILFGTDVGFQSKFDTTQEYELMGRALSWREVLASLTTSPSALFKAPSKGRVENGMDADLVVLDADPAEDVRNLARVNLTLRRGKALYRQ